MTRLSSINDVHHLLSRCENSAPQQILNAQSDIIEILSKFYGYRKRWTMYDLIDALDNIRFDRYIPDDAHIIIKLIYDDEFRNIGIDSNMLSIKKRSSSKPGWYVPFMSNESFDSFNKDMKQLRDCISCIRN